MSNGLHASYFDNVYILNKVVQDKVPFYINASIDSWGK